MLTTARTLAGLDIHSVKPHNLYAVRNTVLADEVAAGRIRLPEFHEYVGYLVDFLEELPGSVVIERLCGDAPPEYLVGPQWCLDKAAVRAAVEAEFQRRGTWQGWRAKKREDRNDWNDGSDGGALRENVGTWIPPRILRRRPRQTRLGKRKPR